MSIEFSCECGHELYAPIKNVGKRLRCPVCQVAVVIPGESTTPLAYEALPDPDTESAVLPGDVDTVRGGPVVVIGKFLIPMFPGKATLKIDGDVLIEESSHLIAKHSRRSSLDSVTGSGVSVIGNPILLFAGILLLPANGFGLLLLVPWLFIRHRVVYVHANRTTHAVRIRKSEMDFGRAFMQRCLIEAVRPGSGTRATRST